MEMTGAIITAVVLGVALVVFVIYFFVRDRKRRLTAGVEDMIGKVVIAQTAINPKGQVLAEGELWTAIARNDKIEAGEEVVITKVERLRLWVTKKTEEKEDK